MKIERSPLELIEFVILNSDLKFIEPKKGDDIKQAFGQYPVDIDYDIRTDNQGLFTIFITITVNKEGKKLPGYSVVTEGAGIFKIHLSDNLPEKDCNHLINFSAVSILINSLRNYIQTLTTFSPFGKYSLPAVDINHLLQEKIKNSQNTLPEKSKIKVKNEKRKVKNDTIHS